MHAIGVDLTARAARAVVVTAEGAVVRAAQASGDVAMAALESVVRQVAGDGIAVFGIALDHGTVSEWIGSGEGFESGFGFELEGGPAAVLMSAGAAAVTAEQWTGAARGARDAVCLLVGDRVLAGILLEGRPWVGAHGLAGAAAWLAVNPVERQDHRKFGGLAAEVSSKGIARRLAWRIQAGDHSAVLDRAGDLDSITAAHVYDGARGGDGVAISVVRDTAKYIGMAVANFATALDPEVIVLGGAAAAAGDLLLEPVRQECVRRLPPLMARHFRCEISPLGDDGVAIGAARLAMEARA